MVLDCVGSGHHAVGGQLVAAHALGDGWRSIRGVFAQDPLDLSPQSRQSAVNRHPHLLKIDREVPVDEDVAHADDPRPGHLRMLVPYRR